MKPAYNLIVSLALFLTMCNSQPVQTTNDDIGFDFYYNPVKPFDIKHPTSYIGKWTYSFPFYSRMLLLDNNNTFKFYEGACMGSSYSEGSWTKNGNLVILTSYDKYKIQAPANQYKQQDTVEIIPVYEASTPAESDGLDTMIKLKMPDFCFTGSYTTPSVINFSDTTYVYFNYDRFTIIGDTLYQLGKLDIPEGYKFVLKQNMEY